MRLLSAFLGLLAAVSSVSAAGLTISIPASTQLPDPGALSSSTHATLSTLSNGDTRKELTAPLSRANTITFEDLSQAGPASYLLEVYAPGHKFMPLRVDITADGSVLGVWDTYRGHPWDNKGVERIWRTDGSGGVTVEARLLGIKNYYEARPKFSPWSLLKNPMIVIGVVALFVTIGMPKLLDNIDPDFREEFERSRKEMGQRKGTSTRAAQQAADFDLAGWMAGTSAGSNKAALDPAGVPVATGRDVAGPKERKRK